MDPNAPGSRIFIGFKGTGIEEELKSLLLEFRPAGLVLFRRNIEGPEQLKTLVGDARAFCREKLGRPLLLAIDQEGGTVQRLPPHFTHLPSANSMAAEGPESIRRWTRTAAGDLKTIGVHINFAPVLDTVAAGVGHFMESRSLGSDPGRVAELGAVWIETLQQNGISATAKHFPGLGRAGLDPHHFAPVIQNDDAESFRAELEPFERAVRAGVHAVMTSHAVYPSIDPEWPATLSYEICRRCLRERLGFNGVLFSDDLDMAAIGGNFSPEEVVKRGLECETDFFLLCQKTESIEPFYRALVSALGSGGAALAALHEKSVERAARLFRFHFGGGGPGGRA